MNHAPDEERHRQVPGEQYDALVDDFTQTLDLEDGLTDVTRADRYSALANDLSHLLDLDTGLAAILTPAETNTSRPLPAPSAEHDVAAGDSYATRLSALLALRGLLLAGLLDRADWAARQYRERCLDTPGAADVTTSFMCAAVAMSGGRVRTAERWLRHAIAALQGADPGGWSFHGLVFLTGVLGMAGDAVPARQALADMTAARHPAHAYLEPDVQLAKAWVAAAEGGVSEALALARQGAEVAASQGQPAVEVVALHTAVCFGDHTVTDRLAELATQVDGPRARAAAAHAAALATDDSDALQATSVRLEEMGALLLAADAAAQAAAVHTRHDRRGSAQAAAVRAHQLAQTCEGARTPALAAIAAPLPLTSREREIVTLAAGGLSNRQIAERLVVSVRTVENYLYRACAKLGITDRAALAAQLHRD